MDIEGHHHVAKERDERSFGSRVEARVAKSVVVEVSLQEAPLTRTLAKKLMAKSHLVSNILLLFQ